jgi:hypothetical protein
MATTLGTIRTNARIRLLETTAKFWTDAELLDYIIDGVKDLSHLAHRAARSDGRVRQPADQLRAA